MRSKKNDHHSLFSTLDFVGSVSFPSQNFSLSIVWMNFQKNKDQSFREIVSCIVMYQELRRRTTIGFRFFFDFKNSVKTVRY
jgi:hypothetical protein